MPSYDDELPTQQEESLLNQLVDTVEPKQRIQALTELKNSIIGSKRSKIAFYHGQTLDILYRLLAEYSPSTDVDILIQILDCVSSFAKSDHDSLCHRLLELGFIQQLFVLLSANVESVQFYEACLRCLRSFFLCTSSSSPLNPFASRSDPKKSERALSSVDILFDTSQSLDTLQHRLSLSPCAQIAILQILSSLCVDDERQDQIAKKDFIPVVLHILVENVTNQSKINLVSFGNEHSIEACLKFFCCISYENASIAQRLHETVHAQTSQSLDEIVSGLLHKVHRPVLVGLYASKYFVHLCKAKVLSSNDPHVSLESLTTLIHLCIKSILNHSVHLHTECLSTLIYLLDGNSLLHHKTIFSEQFLTKLFVYTCTPTRVLDETIDETTLVQIRSATLTLLAVLASDHVDIQKRIAEHENLISTAIEFYRSPHLSLQLAALRLFHGLSRSVDQLHRTFNEKICDILFDAIQSNDLALVKASSCIVSNSVLEFSTCRTKLLSGGILHTLVSFLSHADRELAMNGIWALRNLSYLSTLKVKQDIINGITIDRIYALLEQCTDEAFLSCLLSLLRNLLDGKDTDILLPMFNATRFVPTLQNLQEKYFSKELRSELSQLIDHLNGSANLWQERSSADSVNSSCRTYLFPESESLLT